MGSKDAPQKDAVLWCNKKRSKAERFYTKRQSGGKPPQILPSTNQNRSESQCSCIFQELMNRGKYAYVGLRVKYALGRSSCLSKIPPVPQNPFFVCLFVCLLIRECFYYLKQEFSTLI